MILRIVTAVAAVAIAALFWTIPLLLLTRRKRRRLIEAYTLLKGTEQELLLKNEQLRDDLMETSRERSELLHFNAEKQRLVEQLKGDGARLGEQLMVFESDSAYWKAKAESWELKFDTANADAIKCRETIADWVSQRTFGRKIFDHAPSLPSEPKHMEPVHKQRIQARVAVQQAEAQFNKDLEEYQRQQVNPKPAG